MLKPSYNLISSSNTENGTTNKWNIVYKSMFSIIFIITIIILLCFPTYFIIEFAITNKNETSHILI